MFSTINKWLRGKKGQGLVEYALILVLISIVSLAILTSLGKQANVKLGQVNSALT